MGQERKPLLAISFVLVSCLIYSSILKMKAIISSEMYVDSERTTRRYISDSKIPEGWISPAHAACTMANCAAIIRTTKAHRPQTCGLDGQGASIRFPLHRVQTGSGAHRASHKLGMMTPSQSIKRQEREADHSPPSSAQVKNGGYTGTSIPPYVFMVRCLNK
jgi:hypothetical protein